MTRGNLAPVKESEKYFYNSKTLRFEKLDTPLHIKLIRAFGWFSALAVAALLFLSVAFKYIDSPQEKNMQQDMAKMEHRYSLLQTQIKELNRQLEELEDRDNDIYRSIFETEPISEAARIGEVHSNIDWDQYKYRNADELMTELQKEITALHHRLQMQKVSYDTLQQLIASKEKMLACIPAIQPVSGRTLNHIASGFGYRIDPIYKTPKLHTGLDFAAAIGTPVYATADGRIAHCGYDDGGYGHHVIINHGYGYETLYGHMVRIKAKQGAHIRRGEVIGWVGNTGKSTGPHLHYEVIRNKEKIDPVHFFFNDLTAQEYEAVLKKAAAGNQSFD